MMTMLQSAVLQLHFINDHKITKVGFKDVQNVVPA